MKNIEKRKFAMKKLIALLLIAAMILCGCGSNTAAPTTEAPTTPTEAPTTEATEAPTETTEAPTEPPVVYRNPLNGEVLDEPYTGRVFAVTISNIRDALPHYGTMNADILMEMWVNGSIVRDLALYTNIADAGDIGSVRSDRLMFNQIAKAYDAIICDAAGSDQVLNDAINTGVNRMTIDTGSSTDYSYRAKDRVFTFQPESKYEHTLFAKGAGLEEFAQKKGFSITQPADKDYNLRFTEDGTPDGENASTVNVTFTYSGMKKDTTMVYDESLGKYVYNQYGKTMTVNDTEDPECFTNVIVMLADITRGPVYYTANFTEGGTGYYANGGKIIPIVWGADSDTSPFWFKTEDGEELQLGVGNTYMAIAPQESAVTYE